MDGWMGPQPDTQRGPFITTRVLFSIYIFFVIYLSSTWQTLNKTTTLTPSGIYLPIYALQTATHAPAHGWVEPFINRVQSIDINNHRQQKQPVDLIGSSSSPSPLWLSTSTLTAIVSSNAQLSDAWKWINCLRIDRCTVAQSITVSGHSSSLRRSPCRSEWFADKSHSLCVINVSDWTKGIITRACYEGEQDGTGQDRQTRSEWNEMAPLGSTEDNHRLAVTPRLQVIVCSSHGQSCFPLRKSERNQLMKFPCSFLAQHRQRMPFKLSGQMLL